MKRNQKTINFWVFTNTDRSRTDFVSSFQKESHKLKKDLNNLIKSGSGEMKKGALRLEKIRRVRFYLVSIIVFFCIGRLNKTLMAILRAGSSNVLSICTAKW